MADGDGTTQNPTGQEDPKPDTSKVYSNGYNQGLEKAEERAAKRFSELTGQEIKSLDDAFEWVKSSSAKLADSISDPTATDEYKQLQQTNTEYKQRLDAANQEVERIRNQYKTDDTWGSVIKELTRDTEFIIPEKDVQKLFNSEYSVEYTEGKGIVKQGDVPVMGDNGYKPVDQVIKDFSMSYLKTTVKGTGGGTGEGGGSKPKFADFQKAVRMNDQEKMSELMGKAKELGGWAEPEAPSV